MLLHKKKAFSQFKKGRNYWNIKHLNEDCLVIVRFFSLLKFNSYTFKEHYQKIDIT